MGHPPPKKKLESLAPKLVVGLKNQRGGGAKMVRTSSIFMQSLVEIRLCTAA